jgi:transposase
LLEELGIECRVGHPAKIRAKEARKHKHDRRDARLELELLMEDRFPTIWMPSSEQRDLRTLLHSRSHLHPLMTIPQQRSEGGSLDARQVST